MAREGVSGGVAIGLERVFVGVDNYHKFIINYLFSLGIKLC